MQLKDAKIAIIGLGYVGLPLAVEFAKKYPVMGFDINQIRVDELNSGHDHTLEVEDEDLKEVLKKGGIGLVVSSNTADMMDCNVFIVTVPTPTDKNKRPVLTPLLKASETIGKVLASHKPETRDQKPYVVYESTVYPGVTEDECVPVLEQVSGLKFNEDFYVGYSPERINPGDKQHTINKILKVTSGSNIEAARVIDDLYKSVITAGTHLAPTIKVAEAAKVIENSQRDINIAFVNELAKIFNKLDIDTHSVLEAAGTKWNFLPFKPGLVGGHCIGVDPYYLAQKAQEVGYHPEIILSGRRLNDGMGFYIAGEVVKLMLRSSLPVLGSRILMLGITFKENCPDIRNSKSKDVYLELLSYNLNVEVLDPWADPEKVKEEFGLDLIDRPRKKYHAIVLTVSHHQFLNYDIRASLVEGGVVYDVKSFLNKDQVDGRL